MQYEIYLANNEDNSQQSYIIADPSKGTMEADAVLSWGSIITEQAYLKVTKVGGGGIVLPGATFTLTGSDGSSYTGTTDERGEIFWNMLKPGVVYTPTESDPPTGYGAVEPQTLTLKAGHIEYLTVRDDTLHTLTVRKVDRQTGYSLRGAVMRFQQIDGDFTTTAVTDHAGNIQMNADQLPVGNYKIYEEVAPEGMELDPTPQTVHWDGKRDVTLTFQNTRKMTLIISKQSSTTGYNLPGATFSVYRDGQYVTSVTTNEAGLAYVHDVKEGYWTVKETAAPLNHLLNEEVQGVYISPYDPATTDDPRIVVKDAPLPSLRIVKYNQADHAGMEGVTFEIFRDGTSLGKFQTDKSGEILMSYVEPGTYRAVEVDTGDDAHILDTTPQEVELRAGDDVRELVFFNSLLPGVHLIKVNSADLSKPIPNAKFRFEKVGGGYGPVEYTTGADGTIDLSKLPVGSYVVTELECAGYVVDDAQRIIQLQPNTTAQFVFTNTKLPNIRLTKTDTGGKPMEGVTFSLTPAGDGAHSDERTTNAQGVITWEGLEPGLYSLVEVATKDTHVLDSTEHHVRLRPGKDAEVTLTNQIKPSLRVVKYNRADHVGMEGVTFEIFRDGTSLGKFQTDKNGEILLSYVEPGTYRVAEVDTGDDTHILDTTPQEVELRAGDDVRELVFFNDLLPGLHLTKVDSADLSKSIPNAKFRFEAVKGDFGPVEYTTMADGTIDLSKLPVGSFIVTELECPGYVVDDARRTIHLDGNENAEFVFTNTKFPNFTLTKTDTSGKPMEGVTFSLIQMGVGAHADERITNAQGVIVWEDLEPGLYSLVEVATKDTHVLDATEHHVRLYPGKDGEMTLTNKIKPSLRIVKYSRTSHTPMEGVTFEVFRDTVSLGKFQTNADGEILLSYVEPGTYRVAEVDTGDDAHILDTTPQEVELRAGDDVRELVLFDDLLPGVHLTKVDSADLSKPIANAKFRFEAIKGDFGPVEYTTMADGTIDLSKLPVGSFIVTELECPGYVIDNGKRIIHLDGNENAEFVFTNSVLPSLHLTKTSADSTPLGGVSYRLAKIEDGSHYLDRTTSSTGEITWDGLEPGVYSLRETATVATHILDPKEYHVELFPGKVSEIVLKNDRRPNLTIHKTNADDSTEPVPDAELKALLTEDEYAAARESTLTAFYTPPVVIRAIYQALTNMGFKIGNILEPSCGTGNFLGMIPEALADSRIYGVELDSISGRIAQQLYQTSSIAVQGFERTDLPDSFYNKTIILFLRVS